MGKIPAEECKKHCRCKLRQLIVAGVCMLLLAILLTIFITWLVLRPTKPRFSLQDVTVIQVNLSASVEPYRLTTQLQSTISSCNPNSRIGIYYQHIRVYTTYKSQQITDAFEVAPFYQGHHEASVWSPILSGIAVPVSPMICLSIAQDQQAGLTLLHIKVSAKVKWKVGNWISGKYHLDISCPAFLGGPSHDEFQFLRITRCSVDV